MIKDSQQTNEIEDQDVIEANRLYGLLANAGFRHEDCLDIAPITKEINQLKDEYGGVILAHHYMTPDITFGVADFAEDALGLIEQAKRSKSNTIIMCTVLSLAECVKIACPEKTVLYPNKQAGCSVADSITASDVKALKKQYPDAPAIAYITTTAEVKAESDYIVTSANVNEVINALPNQQILFYPDHSMSSSLNSEFTNKDIIGWDGICVVHDNYTAEQVVQFKKQHPDTHVLFHSEVSPELYPHGELHGGTKAMLNYVDDHPEVDSFFMVTECGLSDRLRTTHPDKKFIGTCSLCPFMKMISLENTLKCLKSTDKNYEITFSNDVLNRASVAYQRTEKLLA